MTDLQQPACTPLNLGVGAEGNPGETPGAAGFTRRQILRAAALGGGLIAGELWWPGRTLISIPHVYAGDFIGMSIRDMTDHAFNVTYAAREKLFVACHEQHGALTSKDGVWWQRILYEEYVG